GRERGSASVDRCAYRKRPGRERGATGGDRCPDREYARSYDRDRRGDSAAYVRGVAEAAGAVRVYQDGVHADSRRKICAARRGEHYGVRDGAGGAAGYRGDCRGAPRYLEGADGAFD